MFAQLGVFHKLWKTQCVDSTPVNSFAKNAKLWKSACKTTQKWPKCAKIWPKNNKNQLELIGK